MIGFRFKKILDICNILIFYVDVDLSPVRKGEAEIKQIDLCSEQGEVFCSIRNFFVL